MTEILEAPASSPIETPAEPTVGWISPTGEFGQGVPDRIKNIIEAKKWNNVEQVVDGYSNLEKMTGAGRHLVIPDGEDTEGWNNVYNQLGRPETPDKYAFEDDSDVPLSSEIVGKFKQFAHTQGYTQKQAEGAVQFQRDVIKDVVAADAAQATAKRDENITKLKQKWGEANYETKVRGARTIADQLGIYSTLEAKGLASDPEIISMLDTIASRAAEDVITPSSPAVAQKSPVEELEEIKKSEAFLNKFAPNRKQVMARYMELNHIIANSNLAPKRSR